MVEKNRLLDRLHIVPGLLACTVFVTAMTLTPRRRCSSPRPRRPAPAGRRSASLPRSAFGWRACWSCRCRPRGAWCPAGGTCGNSPGSQTQAGCWGSGAGCRHASRAVEMAKRTVELQPTNGGYWRTLGWAEYRAGNWKGAVAALDKVKELGSAGDAYEGFLRAMAHWQLSNKEEARRWHDKAVQRMNDDRQYSQLEELGRLRAEAAQLLGIN